MDVSTMSSCSKKCNIIETSVQHSDDSSIQNAIELKKMKDLGLPIQFGPIKKGKFPSKKRATKRYYSSVDCSVVENFDSKENNHIDQNDNEKLNELDDIVNEIVTIKLSNDSYDYMDLSEQQSNSVEEDKMDTSDNNLILDDSGDNYSNKKRKIKNRKHTYWNQRHILFSRFSEGIKLDEESWFSVTPEPIARHIAERVEYSMERRYSERQYVVMDPFCGVGGNIIQFALMPNVAKVFALDIDEKKIDYAKHNASIYGCEHKIEFIVGDFFNVVRNYRFNSKIDVCFLSPPWGGPNYIKRDKFSLNNMIPNGFDICEETSKYVTKNIALFLPRNFDCDEMEKLSSIIYNSNDENKYSEMSVEIEKNMIYKKVKTMTAYFGDLIIQQS